MALIDISKFKNRSLVVKPSYVETNLTIIDVNKAVDYEGAFGEHLKNLEDTLSWMVGLSIDMTYDFVANSTMAEFFSKIHWDEKRFVAILASYTYQYISDEKFLVERKINFNDLKNVITSNISDNTSLDDDWFVRFIYGDEDEDDEDDVRPEYVDFSDILADLEYNSISEDFIDEFNRTLSPRVVSKIKSRMLSDGMCKLYAVSVDGEDSEDDTMRYIDISNATPSESWIDLSRQSASAMDYILSNLRNVMLSVAKDPSKFMTVLAEQVEEYGLFSEDASILKMEYLSRDTKSSIVSFLKVLSNSMTDDKARRIIEAFSSCEAWDTYKLPSEIIKGANVTYRNELSLSESLSCYAHISVEDGGSNVSLTEAIPHPKPNDDLTEFSAYPYIVQTVFTNDDGSKLNIQLHSNNGNAIIRCDGDFPIIANICVAPTFDLSGENSTSAYMKKDPSDGIYETGCYVNSIVSIVF